MKLCMVFAVLLGTTSASSGSLQKRPVVHTQSEETSDISTHWNVTYFETYKQVFNTFVNEEYILYQNGTTPPDQGLYPNAKFFEIPLRTVAVEETLSLTFLELLGQRGTVRYVQSPQYVTSGCLRFLINEGSIGALEPAAGNVDLRTTQVSSVDAVITGSQSPDSKSLLSTALFFNKEVEASAMFNATASRYNCHKRAAVGLHTKEVVVWIDRTPTESVISTNAYKKQLTEDAGGVFFGNSVTRFTNQAAFVSTISSADIIIDEDLVQGADIPDLLDFCSKYNLPAPCSDHNQMRGMYTRNIWRTDRLRAINGADDWWESSIAEPDLMLEDLMNAINFRINPSHDRTWLRNVAIDETANFDTAICVDPGAPRVPRADECSEIVPPMSEAPTPFPSESSEAPTPFPSESSTLFPTVAPTPAQSTPPTSLPTLAPTPSLSIAIQVLFNLTFSQLQFDNLPEGFTSDIEIEVAKMAFVSLPDVTVVSLLPGSVIANVAVDFRAEDLQAQAFSAHLREAAVDNANIFTSSFSSAYGVPAISPPPEDIGSCASHILQICGIKANCETSGDACSFLEEQTDAWCGGTCYGSDCCELNDGKAAGFVVGVIVVAIFIVGVCCYGFCKYYRRDSRKPSDVRMGSFDTNSVAERENNFGRNASVGSDYLSDDGSAGV
eukprot:CAMPEP_0167769282 /NCGR_PEP_ID=MMETSP0110_2-20121227/17212_1 /TAXON_ID=629695 /ORGANISM="Gymnochlora sp., Strain CCMP2014" /LENGTH=666 /DNA_ID=CAMNT_0007658201 /DNA_START=5 /DNA_END=2006 /DNA_ORIENTATION=+